MADITLVDYGSAEAQAQVGLLLQARSPLLTMRLNPDINIAQQATTLLVTQDYLEGQVSNFSSISDKLKAGTAITSDYLTWGSLLAAFTLQNNKVGALAKKAGISFTPPSFWYQYGPYLMIGGVALLLLLWITKRKNN